MLYQFLLVAVICHTTLAGIVYRAPSDTYKRCINRPYRLQNGYPALADEQYDWRCTQMSYQQDPDSHGIGTGHKAALTKTFYDIWEPVFGNSPGDVCKTIRIRKEYRLMTDAERATYHSAVTQFKAAPAGTNYNDLASLHVGNPGAHEGPAFFNWHRIYLQMYEAALMQYEPDVILPYWASSWDNEMANPTSSIMWDERFVGNGNGLVTCGFPANWVGPAPSQLTRNVGASGGLMTQMDINNVMSMNTLELIAETFAPPASNLEAHHGKVHVYVGGHMSSLSTASYDPVFFNHHGFIDCIYEQFRLQQIANGIDVDTDWPPVWLLPEHGPTEWISLSQNTLMNREVNKRKYACSTYQPNCAELLKCDCDRECPSKYLTCDRARQICVPIQGRPCGGGGGGDDCCGADGYAYGGGANGGTGYSPYTGSDGYSRPNDRYRPPNNGPNYRSGSNMGTQNRYCVGDNKCDTKYWAYMAVTINAYRPPNTETYNSYPIRDGQRDTYDIYDSRGYPDGNIYRGNRERYSPAPAYNNCPCRSTTGGVYIQSTGNTYEGEYREYVPIDNRQPVYTTTGYVGVMNPAEGESAANIRVYDECGRACRARCRYDGSTSYVDCDGTVQLTDTQDSTNRPTYGSTYEEATQLSYTRSSVTRKGADGAPTTYEIPTYDPSRATMEFYCDYEGGALYDVTGTPGYNMDGYLPVGNTYKPPTYPDPKPYVPNPQPGGGRYY